VNNCNLSQNIDLYQWRRMIVTLETLEKQDAKLWLR